MNHIDQKRQKTYLNELYNHDIAPQDSQKTLFYYLKTLAYQFIIVIFTFLSIFIALMMFYDTMPTLSDTQAKRALMFLTGLTILAAIMETRTRIKWLNQKKQKQSSALDQYVSVLIEILLILPCPNVFLQGSITIQDYQGNNLNFSWDQLLTLWLLGRVIYVYRFIIHTQLYYGSRPDRLSRLYTVKFGTFNSFKFLINEKPFLIVILMFSVNVLFIPLILLLIQGNFNPILANFMDCIHFCVVTQVTVGYGNEVITIFGRILALLCIVVGVTSTSLLLIFFMRIMEQTGQQQQAHLLLTSLQKRQQIAKARVLRIQAQYLHSKIRCAPEEKIKYQQKVRRFRFQNRRDILFQREQPANVKRLMLSNFSAVIEKINQLKQKQSILGKLIEFTIKTQHIKNLNGSNKVLISSTRLYTNRNAQISLNPPPQASSLVPVNKNKSSYSNDQKNIGNEWQQLKQGANILFEDEKNKESPTIRLKNQCHKRRLDKSQINTIKDKNN